MWGWIKGLWASKGSGGCITVDGKGPATLTPIEAKQSSRSSKDLQHAAGGQLAFSGQRAVQQHSQDGTGSFLQLHQVSAAWSAG
jgi:hypothetical protein